MKAVISHDVFFDFSRDVPRRLLGYNPENGEAPARINEGLTSVKKSNEITERVARFERALNWAREVV